jgi:chemotaxis protein methyltransferase WspC
MSPLWLEAREQAPGAGAADTGEPTAAVVSAGPWAVPEQGFVVSPVVRARARFRQGNALDPVLLHGEAAFDVVFCRNLLIYLHPPARQRVLDTLLGGLASPGLLLAGQAEVLSTMSDQLQGLPGGCALSFERRMPEANPVARGAGPAERRKPVHVPTAQAPEALPQAASKARQTKTFNANGAALAAAAGASNPMADARALADAGQIEAALPLCQSWLRQNPADVEGQYLLGLLESARGDIEAADRAFARVLYLDREHLDALQQRIHLALRRGSQQQAETLRARADRLRARQPAGAA